MAKKNVYSGFKGFILKIFVYFLPRPASAPKGTPVVTLKGIEKVFFKLTAAFALGILLGVLCGAIESSGYLGGVVDKVSEEATRGISVVELILLVFLGFYYAIMPALRYIYKWLKVTGMLFAFSCGYLLCFLMAILKENLMEMILISFISAVVLGFLPLILFKYKHFQLPKHVAKITYFAFVVMTLGGAVLKVFNQVPYLKILTGQITNLSQYMEIRIFMAGINIVIAFLFLFLAYDRARDYIKRAVSKQYEWLATFTLFYTVSIIVSKIQVIMALLM